MECVAALDECRELRAKIGAGRFKGNGSNGHAADGGLQDAAYAQLDVPRIRSLLASEDSDRLARGFTASTVERELRATLDTLDALEANANPRLALETLLLRLPALPTARAVDAAPLAR